MPRAEKWQGNSALIVTLRVTGLGKATNRAPFINLLSLNSKVNRMANC